MKTVKKNKWFWVRVLVVGAGAISGFSITSPETVETSNVDWTACLIMLLFTPLGLTFIIGIQALNPYSAKNWRKPSWDINPFLFKEPLQFFHLGSFHFLAGGLVACTTLLDRGKAAAPLAVSLLSIGIGVWLGVQLCMILFKNKML